MGRAGSSARPQDVLGRLALRPRPVPDRTAYSRRVAQVEWARELARRLLAGLFFCVLVLHFVFVGLCCFRNGWIGSLCFVCLSVCLALLVHE